MKNTIKLKLALIATMLITINSVAQTSDTLKSKKYDNFPDRETNILIIEEKGDGDTSVVIEAGKVKVSIGEQGKISIMKNNGEKDNTSKELVFSSKKKRKKVQTSFLTGFDLGAANFVPEKNVPDRFEALYNSTDVHWYLVSQRYNFTPNVSFKWGLDINWRNYRLENDLKFQKDKTTGVYNAFLDANTSYSKNKLMARYLMLPIMIEFHTSKMRSWKSMGVAFGASFGQLLGGKQKLVSSDYGKQKFRESFGFSRQRIDLIAKLTIGRIVIYGNYGITPMFRSADVNYSTKYTPYSVGLQLIGL